MILPVKDHQSTKKKWSGVKERDLPPSMKNPLHLEDRVIGLLNERNPPSMKNPLHLEDQDTSLLKGIDPLQDRDPALIWEEKQVKYPNIFLISI